MTTRDPSPEQIRAALEPYGPPLEVAAYFLIAAIDHGPPAALEQDTPILITLRDSLEAWRPSPQEADRVVRETARQLVELMGPPLVGLGRVSAAVLAAYQAGLTVAARPAPAAPIPDPCPGMLVELEGSDELHRVERIEGDRVYLDDGGYITPWPDLVERILPPGASFAAGTSAHPSDREAWRDPREELPAPWARVLVAFGPGDRVVASWIPEAEVFRAPSGAEYGATQIRAWRPLPDLPTDFPA